MTDLKPTLKPDLEVEQKGEQIIEELKILKTTSEAFMNQVSNWVSKQTKDLSPKELFEKLAQDEDLAWKISAKIIFFFNTKMKIMNQNPSLAIELFPIQTNWFTVAFVNRLHGYNRQVFFKDDASFEVRNFFITQPDFVRELFVAQELQKQMFDLMMMQRYVLECMDQLHAQMISSMPQATQPLIFQLTPLPGPYVNSATSSKTQERSEERKL